MKSKKFISLLMILSFFCLPVSGLKRRQPIPMKELTDPKSPSYVPFPYPKNREEIIADLKYYAEKYCNDDENAWIGAVPPTEIVLKNLLARQPIYKIGEIIKVKNRCAKIPHDYSWLIYIMDQDGKKAMQFAMDAHGLFSECVALREHDFGGLDNPKKRRNMEKLRKLLTDEDIKNILSDSLGRTIEDREIKKMERVAYLSPLGDFLTPLWKIKMSDNTIYYYSIMEDMIFSIDKKIKWEKDKNGYLDLRLSQVPHPAYLPDSIDEELIVLKAIPRKIIE